METRRTSGEALERPRPSARSGEPDSSTEAAQGQGPLQERRNEVTEGVESFRAALLAGCRPGIVGLRRADVEEVCHGPQTAAVFGRLLVRKGSKVQPSWPRPCRNLGPEVQVRANGEKVGAKNAQAD